MRLCLLSLRGVKPRSNLIAVRWDYFVAVLLVMTTKLTFATSIDLTQKLLDRNELTLATQKIHPFLVDSKVKGRLQSWLTHPDIRNYVVDCQLRLRPYFQSGNILGPLCYHLRQDDKTKRAKYFDFVKRYLLETKLALAEVSEDPRYSTEDRKKASVYLKNFLRNDDTKIQACFTPAIRLNYPKDGSIPLSPFGFVSSCFHEKFPKIKNKPYFGLNLEEEFPNHPGHVISETGWIGGNKVEYLTENDRSKNLVRELFPKHPLMGQLYPLDGRGTIQAFLEKDQAAVFTEEEGFYALENHPVWNQKAGIFYETLKAINAAEQSIFVDVFFLGSSMGASLAKHLIKLLQEKPQLKIFILRDNVNHFGHEKEMKPIYNFLLAYSMNHPDRLVISEAFIEGHRSGLPPFVESLVSDEFLVQSGIQKHLALYGRAVSDHSKVMVIDGKSEKPIAFVGSKNWTDESGSVCYDEVAKVTGPAASIVLDDYYDDMFYGLKNKMDPTYITLLASKGWSKERYTEGQSLDTMIANILKPFDLLNRNAFGQAEVSTKIEVASQGESILRTGMNNFDSTRTNAVDQVIQLILFAQKNIFIKDQFLFDRNVVLALVKAKERNPELDMRVILEPLEATNPKGLPNLLYLDVLAEAGIQVKWKKLRVGWEESDFPLMEKINQEYHMKTISADGLYVITGSANKDQTTMYGSFR